MASKLKKSTAKPTKTAGKITTTKKKPVAKAGISKKKVTKAAKPAAKKTTLAKKPTQKKSKEPKKKVVAKKPVVKKAKPVKKTAVKKSPVKKPTVVKKAASVVKKTVAPVKAGPVKTAPKKPHLRIVETKKEQPVQKSVTTVVTITEKLKPEEPTLKGVKKRIMQPLEVRVIKPSTAGLFGVPPYMEKDNEEFMNEAQKNHFREILWRWKRELMEEVDRTKSHMQDGASRHPDPSDSATQEEEFNLELRTRDRERKLIKKIDEALIRIDNDEYGYCDACGIEIGIRRLEARPTAEMCIDCKTLDEIKERQTRA